MDDLLREAIADAKAVRETALANAKIALEEAFTPRLQSMLSKKITAEMEDAEETEDAEERGMEEEEAEEMEMDKDEMEAEEMMDKEESEDAEEMKMDAEEEEDAEEMMDKDEMEAEEEDSMEESEDAEEEDSVEEQEDAEENEDEMSEQEDAEEEDSVEEQEDAEEEDELDLESVLAELEKDLDDEEQMDEEMSDKEEEDKVDENDVSSDIGKADNKVNPKANDSSATGAQGPEGEGKDHPEGSEDSNLTVVKEEEDAEEGDLDLDEVLKALTEEEDAEEEADKVEELKKEIKETRDVVKFMRAKLNEVNLLNAKLLFSNKLFRAFGLNNNQKMKVVENFDRTKNLREVKLVYATLAESFKKPSRISESVVKGSSSKPVASTKTAKAEVLSEGAELKARFKKLANIL